MKKAGELGRHEGFSGGGEFATLADFFATLAKIMLTGFPRRGSVSYMKHRSTHPTHPAAALVAAVLLTFLAAVAYGQAAEPVDDGEVLTVKSQVVRVGIAVPPDAGPFRLEVTSAGARKADFSVDRPGDDSPLSLVVLLDFSSTDGKNWKKAGVAEQLASLPRALGMKAPPSLVIAHPSFRDLPVGELPRLPFDLPDWGGAAYATDVRSAFDYAIRRVEGFKTPRRALLIVTDRFAELPRGIFEETDARLVYNPALVFALSVHPQKAIKYGSPDRTISRMNLVGFENVIVRASSPFVDVQFRQFVRCANALHVVSFHASEQEMAAAPTYEVVVKAVAEKAGKVLNWQPRRIGVARADAPTVVTHARSFPFDAAPSDEAAPEAAAADPTPLGAEQPPATGKPPDAHALPPAAAADAWLASAEFNSILADPSLVFDRATADASTRAADIAGLPQWVRDGRVTEGAELDGARDALRPLLTAFPAAGRVELFVYRSDAVFLALGNRSLLVVSTGAAKFFSQAQLTAGAAHELAHLFFYDAYAGARDRLDYATLQRIELQCDALGLALSARAGVSPETYARVVRDHALHLQQTGQFDPALVPMYPRLDVRMAFIARVTEYLKHPATAPVRGVLTWKSGT